MKISKLVVRIALVVILLLFALAGIAMLTSEKAHAAEPKWDKWNVAPYASSLEEACRKAPAAIDGFALPPAVKQHFTQILGTACKGGKEVWLTPDMLIEQMWSGGQHPHVMQRRAVGELPVLKSPDGRTYRKGAVAETAKALSWTFVYEGKPYVLYLPYVCFNWSWTFGPVPLLEMCVTVEYTVKIGDEVRFAILSRKRLPASACWQLCDGTDCAFPPSPCDECDWIGPKSVIPTGFEPLHTGRYIAHSEHQVLRFPQEVRSEYIALCDERTGLGESDSWIIQPSEWRTGVTTIVVPYGGQEWPAWGQVDLSKWRKP